MPKTPRLTPAGEVDFICPQGHRVYGPTVEYKTNGRGSRYPVCRTCKQAYRKGYRNRPEVLAKKRAKRQSRTAIPTIYSVNGSEIPWAEYMGSGEKRSSPWNALRPKPEASQVFDEFNEALKLTNVPCRGRTAEFTEYQDSRAWVDDNEGRLPAPSAEDARELCKSCPLLELCAQYADADRPDFGIFGGERWQGGKRL